MNPGIGSGGEQGKRRQGAALPTVLALVTVILVAGLAMGSLSTLSLQFNKRQLNRTRSELAARGGLAMFLARMQEHNANTTLNPLVPDSLDLSKLFKEPITYSQDNYKVSIDFDQHHEPHSVDNLAGEVAKLGWPDKDEVPRVPPFSLDLVINVDGPAGTDRYRATLKRVWPFAVYSSLGPIVLMGQPDPDGPVPFPQPTHVQGKVYTQWFGDLFNGGTQLTGYGLGRLVTPSDVLANIEASAGFHPQQPPQHPLIIGLPLTHNDPADLNIVKKTDNEVFYNYPLATLRHKLGETEMSPIFTSDGTEVWTDVGNVLDGDFVYDHDKGVTIGPSLGGGPGDNLHNGKIVLRRGLALDPLAEMRKTGKAPEDTFKGKNFPKVPLTEASTESAEVFGMKPENVKGDVDTSGLPAPYLLKETLRLTEAEGTHFEIDRSVSNREVLYANASIRGTDGVLVREVAAGLELQGVTLHVKGDLDLGASHLDKPIPISGAGATLVVDGKLVLGNAHIDAQDQGFVIYARDIVLKAGGSFYGLLVASNSVTILAEDGKPLEIEGAIMCGGLGGITLRGAHIKHEPRYLKSINGGGDLVMVSWSKINH